MTSNRTPEEIRQLCASFRTHWVPTPQANLVEQMLSSSDVALKAPQLTSGMSSVTFIEADHQSGATATIRRTMAYVAGRSLYVDVRGCFDSPTVNRLMLEALGDRCAHLRDQNGDPSHQPVLSWLKRHEITSLVFDHIDRGLEDSSASIDPRAAGWFASFLTAAALPTVLIGRPGLAARFNGPVER